MTQSRGSTIGCWVVGIVAATGLVAPGCRDRSLSDANLRPDAGKPDAGGDGGIISRGDAGASTGGPDGAPPVDPAVSRAWTWSPCGTISPAPRDLQALFGSDGKIAVRSESAVHLYDRSGAVQPESDGPADFLTTGPAGEVLVGRVTPTAIALGPIGASASLFTFAIPAGAGCRKVSELSWRGDYVIGRSADTACVWHTGDGVFVTALPIIGGQAALRRDSVVSFDQPPSGELFVVTRDFAGRETSRIALEKYVSPTYDIDSFAGASLVPSGDRLLTWDPPILWDADSGRALSWGADPGAAPQYAIFNPAGDLVLLGGGVFRTRDGTLVSRIDPSSRAAPFAYEALALSPDGGSAVLSEFGRATLESPSSAGVLAILGGAPPRLPDGLAPSAINQLALSADGSLLVANVLGSHAFGVRLAPQLAESRIVSTLFTAVNADVDVSADGTMASIAGDGRALFGAQDGRIIWPPPVPPPEVPLCSTEKLRLSPKKTWAAGASYDQAIDVFAVGDRPGTAAPPPLLRLPAGCGDTVVFSRDERLMATSTPAVYRTAAAAIGWQKVWSGPIPDEDPAYYLYGRGFANEVRFSPDERLLLVSQCSNPITCTTTLLDVATGVVVREVPELTEPHPSFSPDGSWIVAGGMLLHLPSGDTQAIGPAVPEVPGFALVRAALFAPNGDLIVGWSEGSLTRFCRSP